jgi:HSP20 family protein
MRRDPLLEVPMFGRLFNNLLNDPFFGELKTIGPTIIDEGTLPLDVSEDDKMVYVRASLPGFKKEDITVEIRESILSINAQFDETTESKDERFYRKERRVGSVSRRIALPSTVLDTKVEAELRDGVLTLKLPKVEKEQPKKIKIN